MGDTKTPSTYDVVGARRFDRVLREEDASWRVHAACIGQGDLFFIERGETARPAKAICATCPVISECLEYALNNGIKEGIWGGLAERERRAIKRRRREAS